MKTEEEVDLDELVDMEPPCESQYHDEVVAWSGTDEPARYKVTARCPHCKETRTRQLCTPCLVAFFIKSNRGEVRCWKPPMGCNILFEGTEWIKEVIKL